MRNKAPYEVWLQAVKDLCEVNNIDFAKAREHYSFVQDYDDDLLPEQSVHDAIQKLMDY